MIRHLLTLTIGGVMLTGVACNKSSDDNRTAGEKTRDAVSNAGDKVGNAAGTAVDKVADAGKDVKDKVVAATQPSADDAMNKSRDTLGTAVEAAVTKNGFNDLVERFSKADRDRIGTSNKNNYDDLNQLVEQFRSDWKAKYNQDFKLSDKGQVVFAQPVRIQIGNASDAEMAAARATGGETAPAATPTNGNNVTTVMIPASHGAKEVSLRLRNEGNVMNSWKIDVPDTFTSPTLHASLIKHLKMVLDDKANWPADVNEAYRAVSHHVLEALTDTNVAG